MTRALLLFAVLLLGCEDFDRLSKLKPRKVTLRSNDVSHAADGGTATVALPAAGAAACEAWVDISLDQGWQKIEGAWVADGQCELRNVPPGETLLRVPGSNSWVRVTLDDVDLGNDYFGRAFVRAGEGTTVTLDLTNAAPLSSTGLMSMYLTDFGAGLNNSLGRSSTAVGTPTGSVGMTSFPITLNWKGLPLLEPGEQLQIFQGVPGMVTTMASRWTLAKQGATNVQTIDTRNVRGALAMTDVATRATPFAAVTFDPTNFYDALKLELPGATFLGCFLDQMAAIPGSLTGLSVQTTFTIDEAATFSVPSTNLDPFPGIPWTRRLAVAAFYDSAIGSAASPPTGTLTLGSTFQGPADDLGWLTTAAMSPVRDIVARNKDGTTVTLGALESLSPVLAWKPPASGLPNRYLVQPYEVTVGPNDKGTDVILFTKVATGIYVDRPECHIPPEVLKAGSQYVFVVTAENCTAADPKRPQKSNLQNTCAISQNRSFLLVAPAP